MQSNPFTTEIILQNKILERKNEELLKLVEAWQTNSKKSKASLIRSLDMHEIENLIIRYYQVYKIPVSIFDEDGKLLFSIGWKNICLRFHRNNLKSLNACKESVKNIKNRMADADSYSIKCKSEINSIAIPIIVRDENLGTLVINQFLYQEELPDNKLMQKVAFELGINLEEYKRILSDLPVYSNSEVEKMTEHYILFAEMIAYLAARNLQLQEQQNLADQKNEICKIFKEKLEEQSFIIKYVYQCLLQQHQEIESLKNEIANTQKGQVLEYKEKSLAVTQPG